MQGIAVRLSAAVGSKCLFMGPPTATVISRRLGRMLAAMLLSFAAATGAAKGMAFAQLPLPKEAVTADTRTHPVDLIGDAAKELFVVQGQSATIYAIRDGKLVPVQQMLLPLPSRANGKTYYGFARLGQAKTYSVMLLMPDGVYYYPSDAEHVVDAPKQLIRKAMIQGQGAGNPVQYFDFALDLNGDGMDDLLLPESNGFSIFRQVAGSKFEPVSLPRNPYQTEATYHFHKELPEDGARVSSISGFLGNRRGVSDLLVFDANGDGLQDLVYSSTRSGAGSKEVERYDIFLQRRGLTFGDDPAQSFAMPYESNADATFRDINLDGKLDAIIVKSNFDIVNPKTVVRFYIATSGKYQVFTRETERFVTKDPIGLVRVADFNSDGAVDFAMTFFSYQFGSAEDIVDLALASKLKFKVQFYLGRGAKGYERKPDAEKELVISMKNDSYRGYPPVMIVDDMNGDRIMDMVVRTEEGRLAVYPSNNGALDYPRDPAAELTIPDDAQVDYEDVNGDGLNDIMVSSVLKQSVTIYVSSPR